MAEKGMSLELLGKKKEKLLFEVDEIIDGKDNSEQINRIDRYVMGMIPVHDFNGFGDDKQHDKDFESLCAYMQKETTQNVKYLTVMEFYSLLSNMNKKKDAKKVN